MPPNTYESSSVKWVDESRAARSMRPRRDLWQAPGLGFALRLGFGSRCRFWTLHSTRIEAHARSRLARRAGRLRLLVLEAHPCPRAGLLMTSISSLRRIRCLQARRRGRVVGSRARDTRDVERGSESTGPIKARGCRIFGLTIGASSRSVALGDVAISFELDPCGSR
jgi:hypothetical protein